MPTRSIITHSVNFQPGLIIVNFPYSFVTRLRVSVGSELLFAEDFEEQPKESSDTDENKEELHLNIREDFKKKPATTINNREETLFFLHTTGTFFGKAVEINGKFCQLVFSYYKPFNPQLSKPANAPTTSSSKTLQSSTVECKSENVTNDSSPGLAMNSDPHTNSGIRNRNHYQNLLRPSTLGKSTPPSKKRTQIDELKSKSTRDDENNLNQGTHQASPTNGKVEIPIGIYTHDLNILVYGYHLSQEEQFFRREVARFISEKKYGEIEKMIIDWYMGDRAPTIQEGDKEKFHGCTPTLLKDVLKFDSEYNPKINIKWEETIRDQIKSSSEKNFPHPTSSCGVALLSLYLYVFLETCDLSFMELLYDYLEIQEYKKAICAAMEGVKGEIVLP